MYPTFARQEIIAQNLGIRLLCTAPDCFSFSGTSQLWIEEAGVLKNKANVLTNDWKLIFDYTNVQGNISAETKGGYCPNYLKPHYGNGVFGNVYLSAGQH